MAKDLTGVRVAKAFINNTTTTVSELELDFDLSRGEGIAIYRIQLEMALSQVGFSSVFDTHNAHFSVHAENDNLEEVQDLLSADQFQNDSEIIFEAAATMIGQDEAATRGGSAASIVWGSPNYINFLEVAETPLVLAANPTVRVITTDAEFLVSGNFTFYYKYVELSAAEIREAFFRSR
ncbi:hypothetical protein LCGC14_2894310 [marine sediment metagenome]|uniref:Uncharacterized protein n=1 Tax=marine sediment metagenome TaxID=412755 RepID=A0A0F8YI46_9ZZZZ